MAGTFIGVSVGPGDPELMTVKAVNRIKESEVIAFSLGEKAVAFNIAQKLIPEIDEKTLLPIDMPMSTDVDSLESAHNKAAREIEELLSKNHDVVFLVLGDATIYSTFMYLSEIVKEHGYETEIVSGVTSFCAAAALANMSLCMWDKKLHVIPAKHGIPNDFNEGENYILMKVGKRIKEICSKVQSMNRTVILVENCGMENERVYEGLENMPEEAGYYSIMIIR